MLDFDDAISALDLLREKLVRLKESKIKTYTPQPPLLNDESRHRKHWEPWEKKLARDHSISDEEVARRTKRKVSAVIELRQKIRYIT